VLTTLGYAKALPLVEAAVSDPDETVAMNAVEQLGRWPDPTPIETVLKAMEAGKTPALRHRALGSVIDLATTATEENQRSEATIVEWLQRADSATQSTVEKRRILGLLGRLKTAESLRLLALYLDNSELRMEAASGVVQIAPALAKSAEASTLKPALEKIGRAIENADLRDRALRLARTIP
jgi:hypothetical protein